MSATPKDDGGPAYPVMDRAGDGELYCMANGMSLRAHFAGQALAGFCANPAVFTTNERSGWDLVNCTVEELAQFCGRLADAMVEECSK